MRPAHNTPGNRSRGAALTDSEGNPEGERDVRSVQSSSWTVNFSKTVESCSILNWSPPKQGTLRQMHVKDWLASDLGRHPCVKVRKENWTREATHSAAAEALSELSFGEPGGWGECRVVPNWGKGACLYIPPPPPNHWLQAILWEGCDFD